MSGAMAPTEGVRADLEELRRAGFARVELSAMTGMSVEWLRGVEQGRTRRCCDHGATELHHLAEEVRAGGTRAGIVTRWLLDGGTGLKWAPTELPQALIRQWHRAGVRYAAIATLTDVPYDTVKACVHGAIGCMSVANFHKLVGSAEFMARHIGGGRCIG